MTTRPHLVVTVHGIRTYGNWQHELKKLLEHAEPGVEVLLYQYGFFSSLAFLIPPLRWVVARRFRGFLTQVVREAPEGARIDLVAHSFGTYLAASALPYLPKGRPLHTVIFAGSVLRPSFPWYRYLEAKSVGRVVNECGWDDWVLVLCQSTALMMGMAGRIGFHGMISDRFINRYYRFGHGDYFDPHQGFMRDQWLPLLTTEAAVTPCDRRPPLTTLGGFRQFLLNNMQFIKVAVAVAALMLVVLFPIDWARKAEYQRRNERRKYISLLANAQEIPGHDPRHVFDLLKIDAKADGNGEAIDLLMTSGTPDEKEEPSSDAPGDDADAAWWQRAFNVFFGDPDRDAQLARRDHFRANRYLIASNAGNPATFARAEAFFLQALRGYERVHKNDPAPGSYALCLLDYGELLQDQGFFEKSVERFRTAREDIFPRDDKGEMPTRPPSLAVDSLLYESLSLKKLGKWDDSRARLEEAVRIADEKRDDALLAVARNELGWLHIDRLGVAEAAAEFRAAGQACQNLVDKDRFEFKILLFHVRHGLALTARLRGEADTAFHEYEQIVRELEDLMRKDLNFSPKQRRDLLLRLVNSMERRADVYFFARPHRPATALDVAATAEADPYRATLARIDDLYQEALHRVGSDNPGDKPRLLYKKVIGRFLSDLELRDRAALLGEGRPGVTDLEFDEAERSYAALSPGLRQELKVYREIAAAAMGLRAAVLRTPALGPGQGWFRPEAVETLRALTREYAHDCERLTREKVEMLLLALEILTKPELSAAPADAGVEADGRDAPRLASGAREADARRMLAVLGATIKVAAHPELDRFFQRYQAVATASAEPPPSSAVPPAGAPPRERDVRPTSGKVAVGPRDTVWFYLRLGPDRALKLSVESSDDLPDPDVTPSRVLSRGATLPR